MLKKFKIPYRMLVLLITAGVLAASLQIGSLKPYQISVFYWITHHKDLYFLSVGILFFILLGLCALFNNIYCALIVAVVGIGALDISQYGKLKLLHEPVYPWDLKQVENLSEMLNIMRNKVSPVLVISLLILVLVGIVATYWIPRKKTKLSLRIVYILASGAVILGCTQLQSSVLAAPLAKMGAVDYHWDQKQNYLENGFMLAFLDNIGAKIETEPADYNQATMNNIIKKYENTTASAASQNTQEQPNIVFVMDESLFDPTRLTNMTFSEDPMQNFHGFKDTYGTGYSLSPVFGGGTSNVEFEALTGLNMSFINEGGVPYQQVLAKKNNFPSLVSLLKSRGYDATAVHPFDKTFYNRDQVYPVLGFDKFISQDDISDMSAIKQVVDVLNAGADKPQFIHLVTMQNHLPVMDGMNGTNTIQVSGIQDSATQVEMESYAEGVKQTNKADQFLVDSIQKLSRPTIVVVFGDHLPSLQSYSGHVAEMTADQKEEFMHQTPLLVAANFPLDEKNLGTIAPSFFGPMVMSLTGQKQPAYYQLLEQIKQQIPGVSPTVYVDGNGNATTNLNDDQKKLLHDYELVQYDLLYGKGYAASMLK
jgi:phosphoglycerol transferase MdoB-like AlkP superfamily enzyme